MDTNRQIFRVIAQVVLEFDDSHTTFYPPNRANRVEHGFRVQIIGLNCLVIDVKKGSDAEAKGLKMGDQIVKIGSYVPSRDTLWKINYILYSLDPQAVIPLTFVDQTGAERSIQINATFKSLKDQQKDREKARNEKPEPYRCQSISPETTACKLKTFSVEKNVIDKMMGEVEDHKKLILDLRGNHGGLVTTEEYLTGYFFDHDVKGATFVTRDKTKEIVVKTLKDKVFRGDLIVLVDSESASASEVFARVIQLEKRGKVIGDISAGVVMTSNYIPMQNSRGVPGYETFSLYALNLTVADLIMSDGKRLEKAGVIPDQQARPTGQAFRDRLDPVLAYAASLFGANLSAEIAGNFHFLLTKREGEEDEKSDDDK